MSQDRPPLRPFSRETAAQEAQAAEDGWNGRTPDKASLDYTAGSRWRNRHEFFTGRAGSSSSSPASGALDLGKERCRLDQLG